MLTLSRWFPVSTGLCSKLLAWAHIEFPTLPVYCPYYSQTHGPFWILNKEDIPIESIVHNSYGARSYPWCPVIPTNHIIEFITFASEIFEKDLQLALKFDVKLTGIIYLASVEWRYHWTSCYMTHCLVLPHKPQEINVIEASLRGKSPWGKQDSLRIPRCKHQQVIAW